jgi:biopolymer transport protein TolR
MAINISKNNSRRGRGRLMSEINVTPMVDVMLVLLIIFMVTSPMLVAGVEVDLPKTNANPISGQDTPVNVSITKEGEIFIAETKIPLSELATKLKNIIKEKKDERIFVSGDKNVPYGKILETIAEIQNAGFTKVALKSDTKHK